MKTKKDKYLFDYSILSPWEKEHLKTMWKIWKPIYKKFRFKRFLIRLKRLIKKMFRAIKELIQMRDFG